MKIVKFIFLVLLGINFFFESFSFGAELKVDRRLSVPMLHDIQEEQAYDQNILNSEIIRVKKNVITVDVTGNIGAVNPKVFGNNLIGYDPMTYENWAKEYYGYSDFGAGVWDGKWGHPVKEVEQFLKDAGITVVRFPGGGGSKHYDWKKAIGKNRKIFLFGLDEFLKVASDVDAEPVYTVSYFTGTEQDAADLVEYLNAFDDGKHLWAAERAKNGHPDPYNVKYFEIGNEVFNGNLRDIKRVRPEEYAQSYLKYYKAMKVVDPTVQIGVVLDNESWNRVVLAMIGDKVDFGIIHVYPTPVWGKELETMPVRQIFDVALAQPETQYQVLFDQIKELFKRYSGREVPLAITEFNGGFSQDKPVPYRRTLGNALVNAELLKVFMKSKNNILMANHWNFVNEWWGMIANGFDGTYKTLYNPYYKRPNYYIFEMYAKHFGDILLDVDVQCDSYDISQYQSLKSRVKDLLRNDQSSVSIPYLSVNASKSEDGGKVNLIVVNKNLEESMAATIELRDFVSASKGDAWVLNGPTVDATNEKKHDNVKITYKEFEIWNEESGAKNTFEFTFEPHSLTVIEIGRYENITN